MSENNSRKWLFYIDEMISFAEKVLIYTQGLDKTRFVSSGMIYDASLRNLELLGEAATNIPDVYLVLHSEIPWRMIIATRNRLIHGYLGIDDDILWSIIHDDLPELLILLKALKDKEDKKNTVSK